MEAIGCEWTEAAYIKNKGRNEMLRSMYSGISGMKNFQVKLDVIGNNIANVNTYGFKKGRVTFKDLVNQQISGASAATQTTSGMNAKQVGLGSALSSIDTIHTTGSNQTTSRTLDVSLAGDGFFPVATIKDLQRVNIDLGNQLGDNKINGSIDRGMDLSYTRAGNFYLDDRGYLVTSDGMFLVGETGEKSIPTDAAITKSNAALNAITNFNTPFKNMNDSLKLATKSANDLMNAYNQYSDAFSVWEKEGKPATGSSFLAKENASAALETTRGQFTSNVAAFDNVLGDFNTSLTSLNGDIGSYNVAAPINDILSQMSTSLSVLTGQYPNGVQDKTQPVSTTDQASMNDLVSALSSYSLDMEKIGQAVVGFENSAESLQSPNWSNSLSGEAGLIQIPLSAKSFNIGPDGKVNFVDEGGQLRIAGQIRIANFANEGGLEKVGGNLFKASSNSGSLDRNNNGIELNELFAPGSDGVGSLISGTLEMSNVDLAEEFTEMIVAQRGFQSNTKIISTSDEILQELVNLKR